MSDEVHEVYRKKGMRLTEEMSPLLYKYFYAPNKGKAWKGHHMFDKAHTVMLLEQDIIPSDKGIRILQALRQMEKEGVQESRYRLGGHMHCGEAYVAEAMGTDVSGWIHCGRSSGDFVAVGHRIDARDGAISLMQRLNQLRDTLLRRAHEHVDTVMPGYTHLQHAEPITFGFYLLSVAHQLERDYQRLLAAYRHINISPAGCAILTTTNFPIDRQRTADLLGFDEVFQNAKDAIWTQDHYWEYLSAMVGSAGVLGRMADDLNVWHTSEFSMVDIPDAFCGTSSIMPQKKNGYGMETVRGLYGTISGQAMGFLIQTSRQSDACEMITMGPAALYASEEALGAAFEIMDGILAGIKVDSAFLKERAGSFWTQAASLANMLVIQHALPFRAAHQIVAIIVRLAYEQGLTPQQVTPALVNQAGKEFNGQPLEVSDSDLQAALDPVRIVRSKNVVGGTAPQRQHEDIVASRARLAEDQGTTADLLANLAHAERMLEDAVDQWAPRPG